MAIFQSFEAWNNLAKAYIKLGDKKRAWYCFHDALKSNFNCWEVWDNLMVVSVDLGFFWEVKFKRLNCLIFICWQLEKLFHFSGSSFVFSNFGHQRQAHWHTSTGNLEKCHRVWYPRQEWNIVQETLGRSNGTVWTHNVQRNRQIPSLGVLLGSCGIQKRVRNCRSTFEERMQRCNQRSQMVINDWECFESGRRVLQISW